MTNVAAAIGCAQMERIEHHLARRRHVAERYFEALEPHRDRFQLPDAMPNAHHCYWMFSIVIRPEIPVSRDDVMAGMVDSGVETRPVFYPVHWMPPYQEARGRYPVAEEQSSRGISLPTHGKLSDEEIRYVANQLVQVVDRLAEREHTARKAA
jgi:perosamine synthetase